MLIAIVLAVANLDLYDSVSYLLVVRGQQPDLDAVQAALKPLVRASRLADAQRGGPPARKPPLSCG